MLRSIGLLLILLVNSQATLASDPEDQAGPNLLVITCDNLGYGDLRSYNANSEIRTPNLDRIASEGARLTCFYTASPTCTVSRACLLTGRLPQRHGLIDQLAGIEGNYGTGLNQNEILIPQVLKRAPTPYACACFGKWNIGFATGSRPTERGFDKFIGHASGNMDYYRHNYRERHDLYQGTDELHREGEYASDLFADAAIEFIAKQSQQAQPWFVYLAFNAPHFPVKGNKLEGESVVYQAPDRAFREIGLSPDEAEPRRRYAATVYALDQAIGRVLDALEEHGLADNTFLFFMSDNGAFRLNRKGLDVGVNEPLRSGGVTCWEGGLRVPALARWPGEIKPGSVIAEPFWSVDILPTLARLARVQLPENVVYDGKDVMPVLIDGAPTPHDQLVFQYRSHAALRDKRWKIVREDENDPWQLFDLIQDPRESTDLASDQPDRIQNMSARFVKWQRELNNR